MQELQDALEGRNQNNDQVSRDLLDRISAALNEVEIGFNNGEILYQNSDSNIPIEGGCNNTEILQIDTDITLASDTTLSLTLDSLYDPIVIAVDVQAQVNSSGTARSTAGIRLGDCRNLARDTFQFEADGLADFSLALTVNLNPVWTSDTILSLYPTIDLDGELDLIDSTVDVEDTVLASLVEDYIEDEIEDTFTNERFASELQSLEIKSNEALLDSLDSGRIDIDLPEADNDQLLALYGLLQPDARFPITLAMIESRKQELLAALLFGGPSSPNAILSDAVLCESASAFLSELQTTPVYTGTLGQCELVNNIELAGGEVWSDASCTIPVDYQATNINEYCNVALDPERLGNAASQPSQLEQWTHSPGTRLNIGALDLDGKPQPFVRRFKYKEVETPRGTCELEMRVYSSSVSTTQVQKPLMALHGGSWQARASGFIGVETMATHFTNAGFVVFAPFYRLIGERDGNIACNDSTLAALEQDVNDAMDWIQARSGEFDLDDKLTVFGQSAGGHLALSLATYRAAEIRRAILFYAPTDFTDFAAQIRSGVYTNPTGIKILEAVTGGSIDSLDDTSELVVRNSFPELLHQSPDNFPPMFILHGQMDSLLPYRQSVRLCNALAGNSDFNNGPASLVPNLNGLASQTQCGMNGSELHLIAEAEHALDLCIAPGLCLAGSEESADEVGHSIRSMLDWSVKDSVAVNSDESSSSSGGFRIGAVWLSLLLLSAAIFVRCILPSQTRRQAKF